MKKLIIIAFVLMSFVGFSQESFEDMNSYNNTNIKNNATNAITGFMLNKSNGDVIISLNNPYYDVTRPYKKDTSFSIQSGIPYRCIIDNSAGAFSALDWNAIGYYDADSIPVENIRAFTDTVAADSLWVFHDAVGMNAQAVSDIPLSLSGSDDIILKITGSSDTSISISTNGTAARTSGIYSTITGGTSSSVAVEGLADITAKTGMPANSYAGLYGQSSSATLHNYGAIGVATKSSIGDNVGLYSVVLNGGAGDAWLLRCLDGGNNTNFMLRTEDAAGNMGWGIIQDDGTTVAIGAAPLATSKLHVSASALDFGIKSVVTGGSGGKRSAVFGNANTSTFYNIGGEFVGSETSSSGTNPGNGEYGIITSAVSSTGIGTGIYAKSTTANTGTNIAGHFVVANSTGSAYVLQLDDGTDVTGKVPISIDADGHVEMSDTVETNTSFKFNETSTFLKDTAVTLSTGEILDLFDTPIELIPAPGANKMIQIISVSAKLDFNTTAYNAGTDELRIEYNTGTSEAVNGIPNGFLEAISDSYSYTGLPNPIAGPFTNKSIVATTTSTDPITGDSTIDLIILYKIVTF